MLTVLEEKFDFGVPFKAVISMEVESYEPSECPLCQEGKIPVIKPGAVKLNEENITA